MSARKLGRAAVKQRAETIARLEALNAAVVAVRNAELSVNKLAELVGIEGLERDSRRLDALNCTVQRKLWEVRK